MVDLRGGGVSETPKLRDPRAEAVRGHVRDVRDARDVDASLNIWGLPIWVRVEKAHNHISPLLYSLLHRRGRALRRGDGSWVSQLSIREKHLCSGHHPTLYKIPGSACWFLGAEQDHVTPVPEPNLALSPLFLCCDG